MLNKAVDSIVTHVPADPKQLEYKKIFKSMAIVIFPSLEIEGSLIFEILDRAQRIKTSNRELINSLTFNKLAYDRR